MRPDEEEALTKGPAPTRYEHDPEAPGLVRWRQMPEAARWSAAVAALLAGRDPTALGTDAFRYNARARVVMAIFPVPEGRKQGSMAIRQVTEGDEGRVRMVSSSYASVLRMVKK